MILDALRPFAARHTGTDGHIMQTLDVTPGWLDIALGTAHAVCLALDLPPVTVVPYRKCSADHPDAVGPFSPIPNGLCLAGETGEIFVRGDLAGAQLERTVAHEMRHVWQSLRGGAVFGRKPVAEGDARRFEAEWMARAA